MVHPGSREIVRMIFLMTVCGLGILVFRLICVSGVYPRIDIPLINK